MPSAIGCLLWLLGQSQLSPTDKPSPEKYLSTPQSINMHGQITEDLTGGSTCLNECMPFGCVFHVYNFIISLLAIINTVGYWMRAEWIWGNNRSEIFIYYKIKTYAEWGMIQHSKLTASNCDGAFQVPIFDSSFSFPTCTALSSKPFTTKPADSILTIVKGRT